MGPAAAGAGGAGGRNAGTGKGDPCGNAGAAGSILGGAPASCGAVSAAARARSDLLLLSYTGGTSASRKCVEVSHGMALHEVETYEEILRDAAPRLPKHPIVLQQTPVCWAASCFGQIDILSLRFFNL